ncbi:MAG: LPS export ABC transporter periplasmic protein LptC [Bacteroidota bacterium]
MKKNKLSIYLLGLVLIGLISCENDLEEIDRLFSQEQVKVETAYDVQLLYSDSAVVQVRVSGPRMLRHFENAIPHEEFPDGILVEFMNNTRPSRNKLTAKYALRYESKNEVIVRDSVVWQSGKGERLETDELIWDDRKKKIYTKRFVRITSAEEILYGYGFVADQDFNHWEITQLIGEMKVEGLE